MELSGNYNDWRQSPAHIWFLSTFLSPRELDDNFLGVDWHRALGEPPADAVSRFRKVVLITDAPLSVRLEAQYTAAELKELCRLYDLPVSGKKKELVSRLEQANDLAIHAAATIVMYQCTDYGQKLAESYLEDPESVTQMVDQLPDQNNKESGQLTRNELTNILRWLLLEGIILGVAGNAAYDLLKRLSDLSGERIADLLPEFKLPDQAQATYITPLLKIEWCFVPAGRFLMGSSARDAQANNSEKPQHLVRLAAFYVAKYPVTNAQYAAFIRAAGNRAPWNWENGKYPRGQGNHPVSFVSWYDANEFCKWAGQLTGQPIRLPTEAEWEKAARGTDGRIYPWGNYWDPGR